MPEEPIIVQCSEDLITQTMRSAMGYVFLDQELCFETIPSLSDAICINDGQYVFQAPIKAGKIIDQIIALKRQASQKSVQIGAFIFDPLNNILVKNTAEIRLTDKEKNILLALYYAPEKLISREDLLEKVWGFGSNIETHTAETHIYRLRQKIERDASDPKIIVTTQKGYELKI